MPVFDVRLEFTESGQDRVLSSARRISQEASNVRRAMSEASRAGVDAMGKLGSSADDAAEKFAALGKTVLGLVGAYEALAKAKSFIDRGIKVGSEMESYRIGMATLITSMVKLEDGQGRLLEGAQKYAEAQKMAATMMDRIQKLGLETTATTQSLVQGTQSVMASALAAGVSLEKIPDFAVAGAQAMQTLGIPLNQMRTELDALLTGVVNGAQDILAPKLFADKGSLENIRAYIKELKASGQLVDEIFKRLEPFKLAGVDIAQTFTGLMSNFDEALDKVAMDASKNLLASLKECVQQAQDLFLSTKDGEIGISKDFQNIADVITRAETALGELAVSGINTLISGVKSLNKWIGDSGGAARWIDDMTAAAASAVAGFAALTAARRADLAALTQQKGGVIALTKDLTSNVAAFAQGTAGILVHRTATIKSAQASLDHAKAALAAVKAEMEFTAAMGMGNGAFSTREAMLKRQAALTKEVEAAQTRLTAVTKWASVGNAITGAFTGILNMLGGPLGIALTAATMGFTHLMTSESLAAKTAREGAQAWEDYQRILKGVGDEAEGTKRKLTSLEEAQLRIARDKMQKAYDLKKEQVLGALEQEESHYVHDMPMYNFDEANNAKLKKFREELKGLAEEFKNGNVSGKDFAEQVADLDRRMVDAGLSNTELHNVLVAMLSSADGGIATLASLASQLDSTGAAAAGAAANIRVAAAAMDQLAHAQSLLNALQSDPTKTLQDGKGGAKLYNSFLSKRGAFNLSLSKEDFQKTKAAIVADAKQNAAAMRKAADEAAKAGNQEAAKKFAAEAGRFDSAVKEAEGYKTFEQWENRNKKGGGGGKGRKGGRGGKSDAEKLAANADRYSIALEKMRNEVEALENATSGSMSTYDRMVAKINAEKDAAIKNADVKARETVQRKQASQAQAEEMASLEKRKAELDANQKLDELQLKTLRDKSNFYKEFAELTGRTGESIDFQNQLIDRQAQEWIALGIPMSDVQERVRLMKMEISESPWDAMVLGLKSYAKDTGDLAKTMADNIKGAFDSIADSFTDLIMTGKMQFTDFANSIIRDLMRIMVQKAITGPIANGLGGLLGGFGDLFGGGGNALSSGNIATMGANGMVSSGGWGLNGVHGHALGNVFTGLHGYANQIVTRPTLFSYSHQLTRFAQGGVMGEAGPEAVMPLTRMGNGSLGVRADGAGQAPVVNVNIINSTGQQASQQTKTDNEGNKSIEVMVGDMAARQMSKPGTALNKAARSFSGVSQQVTRR